MNLYPRPDNIPNLTVPQSNSEIYDDSPRCNVQDAIMPAIRLMRPGCSFASIDFKHAYFLVSIIPEHRRYLRFTVKLENFTCNYFSLFFLIRQIRENKHFNFSNDRRELSLNTEN